MAVHQSSNPPHLNLTRATPPLSSPVFDHPPASSSFADDQSSESNSGSVSGRKLKFLCSFGGKILPRPSDGALRYIGGHTRIISLRKDVSFSELMAKMADTFAGPVIFKYQLPHEDLDALVSVSCPEDLDNMLEEYDKLVESSPDGSAKLRAFLFPATDPEGLVNSQDGTGQRYVEAGNTAESAVNALRRKDSGASAALSTQNSESTATVDIATEGPLEGSSPRPPAMQGFSPPTASFIDSAYVTLAPSQAYIDPSQIQFVTPGATYISYVSPVPVHVNSALPVAAASVGSGVKPIQTRPETFVEENQYATRVAPTPSDRNHNAHQHQPLSQLLPLPPTYLPTQVPPQVSQCQPQFKLEECQMCQKALPHTHSDIQVQENNKVSAGSGSEINPVFYSHNDHKGIESKADNTISVSQLGAYGLVKPVDSQHVAQKSEVFDLATSLHPSAAMGVSDIRSFPQTDNVKVVQPSASMMGYAGESYSHAMGVNPSAMMGIPGDISGVYGLAPPANSPQTLQQQQQLRQTVGLAQNLVLPDVITEPQIAVADTNIIPKANYQPVEPIIQESVPVFSYENARPLDTMMTSLQVSPTEVPGPVINPNLSATKEFVPDKKTLVVENGYIPGQQVGSSFAYAGNDYTLSGVPVDVNVLRPIDQATSTALDVHVPQNLQPIDTTQVPDKLLNQRVYSNNFDRKPEPVVHSEWLHPQQTRGFDFPYGHDALNKILMDERKGEAPLLQPKNVPNPIAPPISSDLPIPSPSICSPTEHVEFLQEHHSSDSLFSNPDPWKNVGGGNVLPPNCTRMASRDSIASKDSASENHLGNNNSNTVSMFEEGDFQQPQSSQSKNIVEAVQPTKGSAEQQVKKDLEGVAENVASSVLRPSTPPVPIFVARERKEVNTQDSNKERRIIEENVNSQSAAAIVDRKVEDIRSRHTDKVHLGLPVKEDIGRLQIINNSDLEELRELGSGTFGTVYHGKWRGSDVAIKRINDRCFAGKPSEQEKMRADFWNEACKLADLHHPNVVAFYGVVLDGPGGSVATVTEYMVNGSLRNALHRNEKAVDRRKRLIIAMDVAFGMEYLHGKNIVHFDLKSDNLLVNLRDPQRPICKVGDLGLSKVKCQTLISGGVRGTLPWMAPELLNGSSSLVSEKVDVFSFGIVMWELLTGEEPYADLHYGAIIGGIVSNTLRPAIPESCDPEWRELMEQCWSSEPSERPSFTEIVDRLRSVAASLPRKNTGNHAAHQNARNKNSN